MFAGLSFLFAAVTAFTRAVRHSRRAMIVAKANMISLGEARMHKDTGKMVCVRGKMALSPQGPFGGLEINSSQKGDSLSVVRKGRLIASAHAPETQGLVLMSLEKFVYAEVMSPLRRLVSCRLWDLLPHPTLYLWPLNSSTRLALEYRDSWARRSKTLRAGVHSVPCGLTSSSSSPAAPSSSDSSSSLLAREAASSSGSAGKEEFLSLGPQSALELALAQFSEDPVVSPLESVYRSSSPLPWNLLDLLGDMEHAHLPGGGGSSNHRRPIGMHREERILPLGKVVTAVGRVQSRHGGAAGGRGGKLSGGTSLNATLITPLPRKALVRYLVLRAVESLGWASALGVLAALSLRRERGRFMYALRWGHLPHEVTSIPQDDAHTTNQIDSGSSEDEDLEESPEDGPVSSQAEEVRETNGAAVSSSGERRGESVGVCVVCLRRRRRVVFTPCGHRACCKRCALQVTRARSLPDRRCPVCRRDIRQELIRVYDP